MKTENKIRIIEILFLFLTNGFSFHPQKNRNITKDLIKTSFITDLKMFLNHNHYVENKGIGEIQNNYSKGYGVRMHSTEYEFTSLENSLLFACSFLTTLLID